MRVSGIYYGQRFTGEVYHTEPNWVDNGKGRGIHLYIDLDSPIVVKGCMRESLFLSGWIDGAEYEWGHAKKLHQTP